MKNPLLKLLSIGVLGACGSAYAVTCNITATSVPLSTLYKSGTATSVTGTISGSCTPDNAAEATSRPWIYIGVNQGEPPAGRSMTRQNGTELLTYEIYHRNATQGPWTEATGVPASNNTSGGVRYQMSNSNSAQSFSFPYYVRIPTPQASAPAGIYDDLAVTATIRLSNNAGLNTGSVLGIASFGVSASIQHSCYFSTSPAPLVLNYTSFTTSNVTGTMGFAVSCTYNTPYSLALDQTSVTDNALNLAYTLALSASSGTGSAGPQPYTVTGTMVAGQAGTCALASCDNNTATNKTRTLTVTY